MNPFPVHTLESAPVESQDVLRATQKAWGFLPKLHAVLAESPVALKAYTGLFAGVAESTLSAIEQQVVYQAINVFHGCEYCTAGHTWLSRSVGMAEADVQALRNGDQLQDPRLQSLRSFAEQVVRERGEIGDTALHAFLDAGFTPRHVLEIVTIVATKTIFNYVNHIAHTPHESFMSDPAFGWTRPGRLARAA